jgi:exodeoxyribonuclease VII small subunit
MTRRASPSTDSVPASLAAGPAAQPALPESYEAALAELERLVGAMESAQLPLDQLLGAYERGTTLLGFCRGRLEAVEQQVRKLEDGRLQPWTEATP